MFNNILILATVKVILCQVNTNIELLQDEFFSEGLPWFQIGDLQNHAKFLLCVDVYQKIKKNRMMEGRYTTKGKHNMLLPEFKVEDVSVAGIYKQFGQSKFVTSIHCPLRKIAFERNFYEYGSNFYLTAGEDRFCVYMLTLFHYYPNRTAITHIVGKVCNVMADIRRNREELEAELISKPNTHLTQEQEWKPFKDDNQLRYFTCMDVYGKIKGLHINNHRVNGELPIFKRVILTLPLGAGTKNLSAILCPMNEMKFVKNAFAISSSYYIAPSVNKGCAYKLGPISSDSTPLIVVGEVYIQEEICGIFEPVRDDISQLEQEFWHTWNDTHFPENETIPWPDLSSLQHKLSDIIKICENVYWKLHHTYLFREKRLNIQKPKKLLLLLHKMDSGTKEILALHCPMHLFNTDVGDIKPYYITNSVNIGCLYVLLSSPRQLSTVIHYEVCGVYPISYFFNPELLRSN